jgi:hypothetical protein
MTKRKKLLQAKQGAQSIKQALKQKMKSFRGATNQDRSADAASPPGSGRVYRCVCL